MTLAQARVITATYEAYCRRSGREWADRHYLGLGTARYAANLRLLDEARRVVTEATPPAAADTGAGR